MKRVALSLGEYSCPGQGEGEDLGLMHRLLVLSRENLSSQMNQGGGEPSLHKLYIKPDNTGKSRISFPVKLQLENCLFIGATAWLQRDGQNDL